MATEDSSQHRRKILAAVDESEESLSALSWAIDNLIAIPGGDSDTRQAASGDSPNDDAVLVVILHVQPLPHMVAGLAGPGGYPLEDFYFEPEILESVKKSQDETSRRIMHRAKHLCDQKHVNSDTMIVSGDAREGICEIVDKIRPSYLVIGSHGYGALKRTFLGSVSDYCAHNVKCPLVIVRKQ